MKLTNETIKQITFGYQHIDDVENGLIFRRMSKQSQSGFVECEGGENFYKPKCFSTSCVNYDFYTNSKKIELTYSDVFMGSSRKAFGFDVYVNDVMVYHFFENPYNEVDGKIQVELDGNLNRVTVYSPVLMGYTLNSFEVDDGAKIIPIVKNGRLLALGDSITHGYDEDFSSLAYTNSIYRKFNLEIINQAVGGARANKKCLIKEENIDYVTVAYGTNDWSTKTEETFAKDYDEYVACLREFYPDAKIFLISPIYRGDKTVTPMGTIDVAEKIIEKTAEKYDCVYIYGMNLVPHNLAFFKPDKVHPNDLGATQYAFSLCNILEKYID